ncbi:UbiA family prenyltransferase [Lacisediminihabitans sp.]|jgi:4-hydroxybenzoate polyprenyltransferase|uniref:UbiA family prenyltransferase n=1 Tax=Lacisediminihabitans sp. TaxID=2787631 RepID=UPI002F93B32C
MPSKLAALARSTHPGPSLAVSLVAVVLGIGLGLDAARLVLLGLAFLANQFSIGLSNDWLDAERDRVVGRTDKPVALGLVSTGTVRAAAFACAGLAILVSLALGPAATAAIVVFLACGWSYNAWLKSTAFSVVTYAVGFGTIPLIVSLARQHPAIAAPWAIGVGALLGVAAHFANVLPDLDDDRRTGVSGLPHRLGRRASGVVISLALAAAGILAFLGPAGNSTAPRWVGLAATLLLAAGIAVALRRPPTRLVFQLIIAAAIVNVVVLAFSGDRLLL